MSFQKQKQGQAALIAVMLMLAIMISAIFGASSLALRQAKVAEASTRARNAYFAAEAGVEDAVYRLKRGKNVTASFSLTINGATATTTVATPIPSRKEISSSGNFGGALRGAKSILITSSDVAFTYGVQVGNGGLEMENTSQVIGSVYSNGDIVGNNSPVSTGDAFAAGVSKIEHMTVNGSARAHLITDATVGINATSSGDISSVTVGRHAYANRIIDSTIGQNAYYQTSISGSSVGGSQFPATPAPAQLPTVPMPISDSALDSWEADAAAGGTISSPCPYQPANGASIGPVKITCDVIIDGTKIVTMTGPLWITGNFDIKNTAQLKLASSFGAESGILVVDNPSNRTTSSKISVQNSAQILGSGTAGSYMMVVSRNNSAESGGDEDAIEIKNSSNAPIYYAPHGSLSIENSAALKEATAYKLEIKNSATVTYESGLMNVNFSSGPSGGWSIQEWREIQP